MKKLLFLLITFFTFQLFAQKNVNDYKYVIVPKQYKFQSEPDQYSLNSLTKFLLNKYGFEAYITGEEFPSDLQENLCLALRANVETKGAFTTKTTVKLTDCHGDLVFATQEAKTKEKDYKKAYTQTIRTAFEDIKNLNYKYQPLEEDKEEVIEKINVPEVKKETQQIVEKKPKEEIKVKEQPKEVIKSNTKDDDLFYAEKVFNGYILKNSDPKKILTVFDSGLKDVFIVKGKDAIIYKELNNWIYSETNEERLSKQIIKIKF